MKNLPLFNICPVLTWLILTILFGPILGDFPTVFVETILEVTTCLPSILTGVETEDLEDLSSSSVKSITPGLEGLAASAVLGRIT